MAWTLENFDSNMETFYTAVMSDSMITHELFLALSGLIPIIELDMRIYVRSNESAPALQALRNHWLAMKALSSSGGCSWMTADVQSMVEGYAATNSIPLVAS